MRAIGFDKPLRACGPSLRLDRRDKRKLLMSKIEGPLRMIHGEHQHFRWYT